MVETCAGAHASGFYICGSDITFFSTKHKGNASMKKVIYQEQKGLLAVDQRIRNHHVQIRAHVSCRTEKLLLSPIIFFQFNMVYLLLSSLLTFLFDACNTDTKADAAEYDFCRQGNAFKLLFSRHMYMYYYPFITCNARSRGLLRQVSDRNMVVL